MPFVKVATLEQIPPGSFLSVEVEGEAIALYNVEGKIYATRDECTHDGGTLSGGRLEGHVVVCPRHGARFDVTTGAVLSMPAFEPLETFPVRVEGSEVFVDIE